MRFDPISRAPSGAPSLLTFAHLGGPRVRRADLSCRTLPRKVAPVVERRTSAVTWLAEAWQSLRWVAGAHARGECIVFEIGRSFWMGEREWVCTDVGTRTICAVLLQDLLESGDSGPPYSVAEHVLDRYDMDGCQPWAAPSPDARQTCAGLPGVRGMERLARLQGRHAGR